MSTLSRAVGDAREATGRDAATGVVVDEARSMNWLGTLGYLVLLDQLGQCFEPKSPGRALSDKHPFVAAIMLFAPATTDREILALYALRCAFAHEFGLTNRNDNEPDKMHRFLVMDEATSPMIEFPEIPWSGKHTDRSRFNQTRVNLRAVGNLVESVVRQVQLLHSQQQLVVRLPGGVAELLNRFALQER
jgi:hypothetical protein